MFFTMMDDENDLSFLHILNDPIKLPTGEMKIAQAPKSAYGQAGYKRRKF